MGWRVEEGRGGGMYGVQGWRLGGGWGAGGVETGEGGRAVSLQKKCPSKKMKKCLSGPHDKMPLNSRTCQPDRCREGGPRHGAKGKDRDARGRQGGMNRGGRERVPPQR